MSLYFEMTHTKDEKRLTKMNKEVIKLCQKVTKGKNSE